MPTAGNERRSQRRIETAIPVRIRGLDAQGEEFEELTETLEVSRRGLSFLTKRELPVFGTLTIEIPRRGPARSGEGPSDFFSTAAVRGVQKKAQMNRAGVRFMGATLSVYSSETL